MIKMVRGWLSAIVAHRDFHSVIKYSTELNARNRAFVVRQVRGHLDLVRDLPEGREARDEAFQGLLIEAVSRRHGAIENGARDVRDPHWLWPSILESWAILHSLHERGYVGRRRMVKVDTLLEGFLSLATQ